MELTKKETNKNVPNVKKQYFERDLFSMGSLAKMLKDNGGVILRLWANHKHWHIIVKYNA